MEQRFMYIIYLSPSNGCMEQRSDPSDRCGHLYNQLLSLLYTVHVLRWFLQDSGRYTITKCTISSTMYVQQREKLII